MSHIIDIAYMSRVIERVSAYLLGLAVETVWVVLMDGWFSFRKEHVPSTKSQESDPLDFYFYF